MASAMASAAARNIPPPYTIPIGPRIRPPRLLPGTKAANTDPQPDEPPPTVGAVWVQGKWRNPSSKAAKDQREVQGLKVEKALRHATHGMNIYAYSHIRTNQVVYSLSRVMQNNKILPQLLYHGKQTVPSSLRRDVWRPYFSIHFSETPAGSEAGLKAYRRLRELATMRQLSPPSELVIATEADVQKAKNKFTPLKLKSELENHRMKNLPIKNQLLPKKLRAKKLMDQKASSVADAAWVLGIMNNGLSPAEELDANLEERNSKHQKWSSRALRRLNSVREKEIAKEAEIQARQQSTTVNQGRLGLTPHTARRIGLEHSGKIAAPQKGMEYGVHDLESLKSQKITTTEYQANTTSPQSLLSGEQRPAEFNAEKYKSKYLRSWREQNGEDAEAPSAEDIDIAAQQEQERIEAEIADYDKRVTESKFNATDSQLSRNAASKTVQVLWADIRDATWAEAWPGNVYHGELESRAAMKTEKTLLQQKATIDEEGNEVVGDPKKVILQTSTTPHVFGNNNQSGWYETSESMDKKRQQRRKDEVVAWQDSKIEASKEVLNQFDALYQQQSELQLQKAHIQPEFDALANLEAGRRSTTTGLVPEPTPLDNTIRNLTEAERQEVRNSMAAIQESIAANKNELAEMQINYPSLSKISSEIVAWRAGQTLYTGLRVIEQEIENKIRPAFESEDPTASQRLQEIDYELAARSTTQPELGALANLESNLLSSVAQIQRTISNYKHQITDLEAIEPTEQSEARLNELQAALQNENNHLVSTRDYAFRTRLDHIVNTIHNLEDIYTTTVTDILTQRLHLENENNAEGIDQKNRELQVYEEEKIMELLDHEPPRFETRVEEYNDEMREKGVEAPPPQKKGIWARVTGLFGR